MSSEAMMASARVGVVGDDGGNAVQIEKELEGRANRRLIFDDEHLQHGHSLLPSARGRVTHSERSIRARG